MGSTSLPRIVSSNDVRVAQFSRSFYFSFKASNRCRILRHRRWQHLDCHQAIHAAMHGLEDLPHAARPDLIEDGVLAEDQCLGFTAFDLSRLEGRQMILLNQFRDEFFNALRVGFGRDEVFQLAGGNDARIGELLDNLFEGESHRRVSGRQEIEPRL